MYSASLLFSKKIKQKLNINTKSVGALHNRFPVDFFAIYLFFNIQFFLQNLLNFYCLELSATKFMLLFSNNTIELLFENENIKMR